VTASDRPDARSRPEPADRPSAPGATLSAGGHLRAALLLIVVMILLVGVAYPVALVGFGQLVNPHGADGSLNRNANGTVNNSSLLPPGTNSTVGWPVAPLPGAGPAVRPGETLSYGAVAGSTGGTGSARDRGDAAPATARPLGPVEAAGGKG
jgi:K+-transporting ATPase, c chain